MADVKPPEGLDGVNLVPYLEGKDSRTPHETLYWRIDARRAIRHGDWKLIMNGDNPPLLFDLKTDLDETSNVADKYPEIVADLKARLQSWLDKLNAERPELINVKAKAKKKD